MAFGRSLALKTWRVIAGTGIFVLALLLIAVPSPRAETVVRVQLKWTHQFQFAGVYAALAQGYYRDHGIDLRIIEGGPEIDPVDVVASRRAEFGIGNSSLIVDRAAGAPIMVVAPIFQHSPFVVLTRIAVGLNGPRDLAGRTLALETHSAEVEAYLHASGVALDSIRIVPHTGDAVGLFASGIDAMSAYTTSEPFDLLVAGVPFQMWSPREIGIDFYGDTLFVDSRFAASHPEAVRAVRDATLRGWRYALAHTGEIISLIQSRYAPDLTRQKLEFEANDIRRLMLSDIVDVGYGSGTRWRHIADVFANAGMMPPDVSLDGFVFEEPRPPEPVWPYVALTGAAVLVIGAFLVAHRYSRTNAALREQIEARRKLEAELGHLARTDELTQLPNRRMFIETATALIADLAPPADRITVILFDIDNFKSVNDHHGHAEGDRTLVAVADACRTALAANAMLARVGGEEFAVALAGADEVFGRDAAERLRASVAAARITTQNGAVLRVTASFGVVTGGPGDSLDTLLTRADAAMYAAKRAGRDRVAVAASGATSREEPNDS